MIIDVHTHAFPDIIAEKAIQILQDMIGDKPFHKGTINSLLESMDKAGIDKSVICNIATKPAQFDPILEWSKSIRQDRIIPLCSIHPDTEDIAGKIKLVYEEGIKGFKQHPYYQGFIINEEKIFPFYENLIKYDLVLVTHAGFDNVFPMDRVSDPEKILDVILKFPELKIIVSHFGGWKDWKEAEKYLIGKNIYLDISYSLNLLSKKDALRMINNHPSDYIMFGTDTPWTDQKNTIDILKDLELDHSIEEKILYENAKKFFCL